MLGPGVAYLRWLRNRGVTMRRVLEAARADDGAMSFAACRDAEPIASRDAANSNVRRRVTFFFTRGHHKSDAPVQFVPVSEPAGLPAGPAGRGPWWATAAADGAVHRSSSAAAEPSDVGRVFFWRKSGLRGARDAAVPGRH